MPRNSERGQPVNFRQKLVYDHATKSLCVESEDTVDLGRAVVCCPGNWPWRHV